jgi:hypothetical protein
MFTLLSGAFLIMGTVLIGVVARAVFSPGRVTHHRIIGAILVYLSSALTFVALYSTVGLVVPNAFSGMSFRRQLGTRQQGYLFQLCHADLDRPWRCLSVAPGGSQSL